MQSVTAQHIIRAQNRLGSHIFNTPLIKSHWLSNACNGDVWLKLENEQITGSFKARGSLNKLLWLREQNKSFFPVTASSGNHGLGFARALSKLNMEGKIFLPENVEPSKAENIQQYNVETVFNGRNYDEMEAYALQQADKNDWLYVSPYNDVQIIAGQGTIALEIAEKIASPDATLATVGGGGLISGIGTYMQEASPNTKIVGCQPENSPEMSASVQADTYQEIESKPTLSDGSAGGFEKDSITLGLCKKLVDDFILVSEDEIKEAIFGMLSHHHKVIEGAAGVAVASLLKQPKQFAGQTTVIVICGANISPENLKTVLISAGNGERQ